MAFRYPYTNLHELNLDWILEEVKKVQDFDERVTRVENREILTDEELEAVKAAIAPTFNTTTAYAIGAYVWRNDNLYRFDSTHYAGAWDASQVTQVTNTNELRFAIQSIAPRFNQETENLPGTYVFYSNALFRLDSGHAANQTWANTPKTYVQISTELEALTAADADLADSIVAIGDDVNDLKSAVKLITGNEVLQFIDGYFIDTSGVTADVTALIAEPSFRVSIVQCSEGDIFTINARGASMGRTWAFVANDGTVLDKVPSTQTLINAVITAPVSTKYLVINDYLKTTYCYWGDPVIDRLDKIEPQINGVSKTIKSGNLYPNAPYKHSGEYYYKGANVLVTGTNPNFSCFIVPVVPNSVYSCDTSNVVLLDDAQVPIYLGGTYDFQNCVSFVSKDAVYAAVSFRSVDIPENTYVISEGTTIESFAETPSYELRKETPKLLFSENNTALLAGATETVKGKTAIKDGLKVIFKGFLTAFNTIKLNFSGTGSVNYITVNSSSLEVKNSSGAATSYTHGLTITNDIFLMVEFIDGNINITIESNGSIYKENNISWYQTGGAVVEHQIISTGTICSASSLKVVYDCAVRKIWYFGDSYAAFNSSERWAYYADEYGFLDNMAVSGSGGCSSSASTNAFITMLTHGTPDYAVFATGMNDGNDSAVDPSTTWKTNIELFIEYCKALNIVPILATVPTVPTVNNEQKNAYVRNSGYRYIDFAKAVGAQSDGTWYSGMLSSDNVHPSQLGAKALFSQLVSDLPEITA